MKLRAVTITGADDSTFHKDLETVSQEFPFVEWAIIHSTDDGVPRHPSSEWRRELSALSAGCSLAAHLEWDFLQRLAVTPALAEELRSYPRITFNIFGRHTEFHREIWPSISTAFIGAEISIQAGEVDSAVQSLLAEMAADHTLSVLLDASVGRGIVPGEWIAAPSGVVFGFAGGLNPDNISAELERMASTVGNQTIWIDMETGVRTSDDLALDLSKVRRCLAQAQCYV